MWTNFTHNEIIIPIWLNAKPICKAYKILPPHNWDDSINFNVIKMISWITGK